MKQGFWNVIIASGVIFLVVAGLLQASIDRGMIQGTVSDPQKAVMPGVKVLVKNVDTGVEVGLTTNSVGFFLAPELVPGKYQVRFEATGFSALEINEVQVTAGTTTNADGEMKIGQTTERIEVTAEPPLLETTSSNFSTGVSTRYLEDLPLQGRDIQTLVQLFPAWCSRADHPPRYSAPIANSVAFPILSTWSDRASAPTAVKREPTRGSWKDH